MVGCPSGRNSRVDGGSDQSRPEFNPIRRAGEVERTAATPTVSIRIDLEDADSRSPQKRATGRIAGPTPEKNYTIPMHYEHMAIPTDGVPPASHPLLQHALDTYAGETNKVVSVWRVFRDEDLAFRPHPRSSAVVDILKHQLLSERRFFAEFLGAPEPAPSAVLP